MRTCFLCSLNNEAVLKAMFKVKDNELTFVHAIQLAIETEEAAKVAKETVYGQQLKLVNKVQLSKKTPRQEYKPCYRCDKTGHDQKNCCYKHSTCNYCKNRGHLEAACRKKKKAIRPERKMPEVKTIRAIFEGERNRVPELQLPVKLNGTCTFDFEVDTGAGDNFLGSNTWRDLGQLHLTESHRQFESASQHKLPVKGCVTLNSQVTQHNFPSQTKALDFQVTELTNLNLLGRNGIQELGILVDALLNRST